MARHFSFTRDNLRDLVLAAIQGGPVPPSEDSLESRLQQVMQSGQPPVAPPAPPLLDQGGRNGSLDGNIPLA